MSDIIDYRELADRLEGLDARLRLVRYIYRVQGFNARRLDYEEAARALHLDRHTISRYMKQLADAGIICFGGNDLQISEALQLRDTGEDGAPRECSWEAAKKTGSGAADQSTG